MPRRNQPRRGSLQYWPRKRSRKILPSVNWKVIPVEKPKLLGFIAYKVGMASCLVKDNTEHSFTKSKKIIIPVTVLEVPPLKIISVRFYKDNLLLKEIFVGGDKELKRKLKLAKKQPASLDSIKVEDYNCLKVIVCSQANRTGIKKTPDIAEIALSGKKEEQFEIVKNLLNKDILISDVFPKGLVDIRGLTKGKGLQGPVKRFGVSLRQHKSEKGVRKVGSIGPWHPPRVMFSVAMAGQLGFFSRICFNNQVISIGKTSEKNINPGSGWKHYGKIKSDYLILKGSVPGPAKRQLLLTEPLRPTKKQEKKNFEFIGIVK